MSQPRAGAAAGAAAGVPGQPAATSALDGGPLPEEGLVVLDASFVLALLQRHPGATALAGMLARGVRTSVTAGEVYAKIATSITVTDPRTGAGCTAPTGALGARVPLGPLMCTVSRVSCAPRG